MKIRQKAEFKEFNGRVVRCDLSYELVLGGQVINKGEVSATAKCSEKDTFDSKVGKRIAEARAIKLMVLNLRPFVHNFSKSAERAMIIADETADKLNKMFENEKVRLNSYK